MNFTKALGMEPKTTSNSGFKINMKDFVSSAGDINLPRIPPPPPLQGYRIWRKSQPPTQG
jgi:hypothetical protein